MEYKTDVGYVRRGEECDQWLVDEAAQDRWTAEVASWIRHIHEIYVFVVDGKTVGFVVPMRDPDGYWRKGTVYLTPSARGPGAMQKYTGGFFSIKKAFNFGMDVGQLGVAA